MKWWNHRKAMQISDHSEFSENVFLHNDILDDPHKLEEMQFYLDFLDGKDSKKVHTILEEVMILDMSNKPQRMNKKAEELLDLLTPPEADAVNDETSEAVDYSSMTKAQLVAALTEAGVEFDSTATKAELLDLTGGL